MAGSYVDDGGRTRRALREIVAEYGQAVLSEPGVMSGLLADYLPDEPGPARAVLAAVADRVAESLLGHVSDGMDAGTAARLVASSFARATMFAPEACSWVVGEFAVALGLVNEADGPPTVVPRSAGYRPTRLPSSPREAVTGVRPGADGELGASKVSPAAGTRPGPGRGRHRDDVRPPEAPRMKPSPPRAARGRLVKPASMAAAAAALLAVAAAMILASQRGTRTPDSRPTGIAYVVDSTYETLTSVNLATGALGRPVAAGSDAIAITVTPDGKMAYVVDTNGNASGPGTVTPIDLVTSRPRTPINVGEMPIAIAITPAGRTAYVANAHSISVLDLRSGTQRDLLKVRWYPVAIAITPDGKTAYVVMSNRPQGFPGANEAAGIGRVIPLDLATRVFGAPIRVGRAPHAIAIAPDGKTAYVANWGGNTITPIDLVANRARAPIRVGLNPSAIVITPDGQTACVANQGDDTVTVINLATGATSQPIPAGPEPGDIAISPDGGYAYVSDQGRGEITPIHLKTDTPGNSISIAQLGADPAREDAAAIVIVRR